jgi:hypothetical protein
MAGEEIFAPRILVSSILTGIVLPLLNAFDVGQRAQRFESFAFFELVVPLQAFSL